MSDQPTGAIAKARNAERMKFFTDAVVAIAMTLLILPLLESVSEAATAELDTAEFLAEHAGQLLSFVLSFVIIASFWVSHERLFSLVASWRGPLMVLNVGWMLCIVFLPVITAMVGSMRTDNLQLVLYVGTMLVTSLLTGAMNLVIRRSPDLWEEGVPPGVGGLAASLALSTLYAVALVIGLLLPSSKLLSLFVLFLSGPLQRVFHKALERRSRLGSGLSPTGSPGR